MLLVYKIFSNQNITIYEFLLLIYKFSKILNVLL